MTETTARRQFVVAKFRLEDRRTYTYHNDGAPVKAGDQVKVTPARGEEGWVPVHVVAVSDEVPAFTTKPILGLVPPPEPELGLENDLGR
jgi:hypothetical protein